MIIKEKTGATVEKFALEQKQHFVQENCVPLLGNWKTLSILDEVRNYCL